MVATIQALGSDVVALQEILDNDALEELASALGFRHVAAEPDGRGNRVGFISRNAPIQTQQIDQWILPLGSQVQTIDGSGAVQVLTEFSRPAFQITIDHGGSELDIVTAHLKSKLLTFGGNFSTTNETLRAHTGYFALQRRSAEATSLREHVTGLLTAGRSVVLLGDLNDGPEAATTQILHGEPTGQPTGPDDATRASSAFQRADQGDALRLFNVTKLVPEEIRWTRRHNSQKELLDHILCSEELMPRAGDLRQVPVLSILNDDVPNMVGAHPLDEDVVPDHAPVTATFV